MQQAGLGLMIGGMVETRLAMGFAAHIAAGINSFRLGSTRPIFTLYAHKFEKESSMQIACT